MLAGRTTNTLYFLPTGNVSWSSAAVQLSDSASHLGRVLLCVAVHRWPRPVLIGSEKLLV